MYIYIYIHNLGLGYNTYVCILYLNHSIPEP